MEPTEQRQHQVQLLQLSDMPKREPGHAYTFTRTSFSSDYEAYVREITNPDGRGENAYDPDKERQMLPQDRLVKSWGWFHGKTGFSVMFRWASGRQDAWVLLDVPNATKEMKAQQRALIEAFKKETANVTIH